MISDRRGGRNVEMEECICTSQEEGKDSKSSRPWTGIQTDVYSRRISVNAVYAPAGIKERDRRSPPPWMVHSLNGKKPARSKRTKR